jgi:hypothetical protein
MIAAHEDPGYPVSQGSVPMSDSFELDAPDTFTVGAVGPPGERVFYLQARQAARCSR